MQSVDLRGFSCANRKITFWNSFKTDATVLAPEAITSILSEATQRCSEYPRQCGEHRQRLAEFSWTFFTDKCFASMSSGPRSSNCLKKVSTRHRSPSRLAVPM